MKRSEMVLLLTKVIERHTKAIIWTDAGLANDILQEIERAGMLPPDRVISEPKWVDGDGVRYLQGRRRHRSWELEEKDEAK